MFLQTKILRKWKNILNWTTNSISIFLKTYTVSLEKYAYTVDISVIYNLMYKLTVYCCHTRFLCCMKLGCGFMLNYAVFFPSISPTASPDFFRYKKQVFTMTRLYWFREQPSAFSLTDFNGTRWQSACLCIYLFPIICSASHRHAHIHTHTQTFVKYNVVVSLFVVWFISFESM